MPNLDALEEELIAFIQTEVNPNVTQLGPDTDLLGGETLDSLGILAVIGYLEDRFGFEIEVEEVSLESFRTVATIRALVVDKLRAN